MSQPEVVGELVARERRSDALAVYAAAQDRSYSYFDLCNTAAKTGNVLRHVGVRPGDTVWIDPRLEPEPVVTFLGATQLGAVVRFVGPHDGKAGWLADEQPTAVVVHAGGESVASVEPGTSLVVYNDQPDGANVTHWETEVWSENPAAPPVPIVPTDPAVVVERDRYSHRALLETAQTACERASITADTAVELRASLTDPRALAAGVLAPLLAGGTVVLPDGSLETDQFESVLTVGEGGGQSLTPESLALAQK